MTDTTDTTITTYPVYTTAQDVPAGMLLIDARARATKGATIDPANRLRCILVPEGCIQAADGTVSSKFAALVNAELHALARARLDAAWTDNDPRTVPAAWFTVDALLAYFAEKRAAANIDGAKVTAWLAASATLATLEAAKQVTWTKHLPKLAAPGYKGVLTATQAASILAQIKDDDLTAPAGAFVAQRLAIIMNATSAADVF